MNVLFQFLLLCLILTNSYSQCPSDPVVETMYVKYEEYCTLVYDPCRNNTLTRCSQINCPTGTSQCVTTLEFRSILSCRRYCCQSGQNSINQGNPLSAKLCMTGSSSNFNSEESDSYFGGYILIAVISTMFIVIFVAVCICRKYRSEGADLLSPNQNGAQPTVVIPGTCVDLNAYDINQQGPYFVNSKDTCAICLDNEVNLRTHCNHFYHGNCLLAWLKKKINNPCPLCMGINYNPVKVYCKECHSGDILVNIHSQTNPQTIKEYDIHKCINCKRTVNSSFTLSDEGNTNPKLDEDNNNQQLRQQNNQISLKKQQNCENQETQKQTSNRRRRKIQRRGKASHKSAQQIQRNQKQISAKQLHHDHNKTQIFP